MKQAFQQLTRTLADAAVADIRHRILTGSLSFGAKIDQASLAEELAISLVPLREALRKLEADGLVRIVAHRGAFVRRISREEIEDLYAIRERLEAMATAAAVPRLTDENMARLAKLLSGMEWETSAIDRHQDYGELLRLNQEFHFTIYEESKRRFMCEVIRGLWDKASLYRSLYVYLPGRSNQALQEHREILLAVQNRWVRAVRNNIRQTMVGLLLAFDMKHQGEMPALESRSTEEEVS
jgi:DNA-binding GntR family transcriptional regulator